jgi:hypothetical protein
MCQQTYTSLINFAQIWRHRLQNSAADNAKICVILTNPFKPATKAMIAIKHGQNDKQIDDRILQLFGRCRSRAYVRTYRRMAKMIQINLASFSNMD